MELWVRSQDKALLCQAKLLDTQEFVPIIRTGNKKAENLAPVWGIVNGANTLGCYATKERCLEILDEIQKLLIENSDPLVLLENNIDNSDIQDGAIIECSPKEKAKVFQKSALVYEMPEK